ncbi:MAG: hypothetical protein ABI218_13570, partial [Caldimonas sp.]
MARSPSAEIFGAVAAGAVGAVGGAAGGVAATRGFDATGLGGGISRPASLLDSVMTASLERAAARGAALAGAADAASDGARPPAAGVTRGGGMASGGNASRRGISIGMSTGIGRGWVSKT